MVNSSNVKSGEMGMGGFMFFHMSYQVMASKTKLSNSYTISILSISSQNLSLDTASGRAGCSVSKEPGINCESSNRVRNDA